MKAIFWRPYYLLKNKYLIPDFFITFMLFEHKNEKITPPQIWIFLIIFSKFSSLLGSLFRTFCHNVNSFYNQWLNLRRLYPFLVRIYRIVVFYRTGYGINHKIQLFISVASTDIPGRNFGELANPMIYFNLTISLIKS